ncbi:MAG: Rne/Rng family ribonuclease, partial [Actinobacteria bacterium]|nr:Rne/Rng family ribonuclease [Actinomycetota bacterium]
KLPDTERNRLKHILKKVMPENAGVIVRTAAEGAAEAELDRDVTRLAAQWENIEKKAKTASAPALLYGEPDLTIRVVRDVFNEDFSKLIVSGDEGWETIDEYVRYVAPHLADRLSRWDGDGTAAADDSESAASPADASEDVFAAYRIDEQLAKALERKVWLPSGGSLVIDRTEAMTVIDVNTGKFTGQGGNLEETVTRNNLEAAEEIVRQLRLRDVGGIVVIDFIDMVLESNRELVLRRLLECLARDRTKHQVAEVTSLGLVQMTRKRVGAGLLEAFSEQCECCNGRGLHITLEPAEPSHRSSAGHSGGSGSGGSGSGSGGSRRSGRSGGTDTAERSERGGRRGKRDGRGASSAASTAAASAAKIAAASMASAAAAVSPDVVAATEDLKTAGIAEPGVGEAASGAPETSETPDGSAASAGSGSRAGSRAPKRPAPSVSAWAVSTSPAEDSPVAVSVPVPAAHEPVVVEADAEETAAPARRTRTRAGSAVARRAEAVAESASAVLTPATDEAPAAEAVEAEAPAADAPASEAVPAVEAPEAEAPAVETPEAEAPEPEAPAVETPEAVAPEAEAPEAEAVAPEAETSDAEAPAADAEAVPADTAPAGDETPATADDRGASDAESAGEPTASEPGETSQVTEEPVADEVVPPEPVQPELATTPEQIALDL